MQRLHEASLRILILLAACAHEARGSCVEPAANPAATPAAVAKPAPAVEPQAEQQPAAAEAAAPPSVPALDLSALEHRLRDTRAIGLFTKLSLRNQVDDLLAQFRAFYQGGSQFTLGELREKYELLLMRVVSLLQDGDPALAGAVLASRAAIWAVLSDPKKFAAI
jgi:hypothetical protein